MQLKNSIHEVKNHTETAECAEAIRTVGTPIALYALSIEAAEQSRWQKGLYQNPSHISPIRADGNGGMCCFIAQPSDSSI